jgi:hypothetical protein
MQQQLRNEQVKAGSYGCSSSHFRVCSGLTAGTAEDIARGERTREVLNRTGQFISGTGTLMIGTGIAIQNPAVIAAGGIAATSGGVVQFVTQPNLTNGLDIVTGGVLDRIPVTKELGAGFGLAIEGVKHLPWKSGTSPSNLSDLPIP